MSLGYSLLHSMVDFVGSWTSKDQVQENQWIKLMGLKT